MNRKALVFVSLGFELIGLVVAGVFVGEYVDKRMNWPGYASAALIVLMMIAWFKRLLAMLKRIQEDESSQDKDSQS